MESELVPWKNSKRCIPCLHYCADGRTIRLNYEQGFHLLYKFALSGGMNTPLSGAPHDWPQTPSYKISTTSMTFPHGHCWVKICKTFGPHWPSWYWWVLNPHRWTSWRSNYSVLHRTLLRFGVVWAVAIRLITRMSLRYNFRNSQLNSKLWGSAQEFTVLCTVVLGSVLSHACICESSNCFQFPPKMIAFFWRALWAVSTSSLCCA